MSVGFDADGPAFVDTGAWYALVSPRGDHDHHDEPRRIPADLTSASARLFATNFALADTHAPVLKRLGRERALAVLTSIERSATTAIIRVTEHDEDRARAILVQYADADFSLTDATSFAVMEQLGITRAFSSDKHFAEFGFTTFSVGRGNR